MKQMLGCHSQLAQHLYWYECIQMSHYTKEECNILGIRYTITAVQDFESGGPGLIPGQGKCGLDFLPCPITIVNS